MPKVRVLYFKTETGKFYTSEEYRTRKHHMFEIFDEFREKFKSGNLPGLIKGVKFFAVVDAPRHPYNYPALFIPKGGQNGKRN